MAHAAIDDPSTWPIVALPLACPWTVARVGPDGACRPIGALPVSEQAIVRWDEAATHLWALEPSAGTVTGYAVDGDDVREVETHALPPRFDVADMAVDDRRIYIGGAPQRETFTFEEFERRERLGLREVPSDTEPMAWYRDARGGAGWAALPMPELDAFSRGKAVDALVLDGHRLVVVDDIVKPKWFFTFARKEAGEPRHLATIDLHQGPNESTLRGAAVSSRWIALRSYAYTRGGASRKVTVFARDTLQPHGRLNEGRGRGGGFGGLRSDHSWGGATFVGEHLLVAAFREGLLEVDCSTLDASSAGASRVRAPFALLERTRTVAMAGAERVVDVVAVEPWGGALVIAADDAGRRAVWHRVGS